MKCWRISMIYLWLHFPCFPHEQKPADRSSWTAGCSWRRRTPKGCAISFSCSQNQFNAQTVAQECVSFNFPHRPSELWKNTFLPQQSRSSMRTKLRAGSLWTRYPEATTSTAKPSGGFPRNSSSGVTVTLLWYILLIVMLSLSFPLLSVMQRSLLTILELQFNSRQMISYKLAILV